LDFTDTAIYMLDAGIKKSPRGGEIPKQWKAIANMDV
jgi:hypothetical protein